MLKELRDWAEELACRAGFDGLPSTGRAVMWAGAGLALCVVAAVWLSSARGAAPVGAPTVSVDGGGGAVRSSAATRAGEPAALATVTVHVVGEVRRPGVYELPGGSRATDAVAAAGGLLGAADQAAVNLARVVADGEQIAVPRQGEGASAGVAGPRGASGGTARPGKVDLNTATEAQLDALPGIGPSTASKIVNDRTSNGPFRTVDDLMRVPGIGPGKLDALRDLVTAG
jgi:competence protein ComEA